MNIRKLDVLGQSIKLDVLGQSIILHSLKSIYQSASQSNQTFYLSVNQSVK